MRINEVTYEESLAPSKFYVNIGFYYWHTPSPQLKFQSPHLSDYRVRTFILGNPPPQTTYISGTSMKSQIRKRTKNSSSQKEVGDLNDDSWDPAWLACVFTSLSFSYSNTACAAPLTYLPKSYLPLRAQMVSLLLQEVSLKYLFTMQFRIYT